MITTLSEIIVKRIRSYRLCLVWTWIIPHVFGRGVCTGLTVLATVGEVQPSLAQTSFQNLQYRWYTDEEPCKDIRRSQTLGFDDVRDKALFQNIAQIGANSYRKMSDENRENFGDAFGRVVINGGFGQAVKINSNQLIVPYHVIMKATKDKSGKTLGYTKGSDTLGLVVQPKNQSDKKLLLRLPIDWETIEASNSMGPNTLDLEGAVPGTDDWMILTFDDGVLDGMSELPLLQSDPDVFERKLKQRGAGEIDPETQMTALSYGRYLSKNSNTLKLKESKYPGLREINDLQIKEVMNRRSSRVQNLLITDADAHGGESGRPYIGRIVNSGIVGLRAIHIGENCFAVDRCKDGLGFDRTHNSTRALLITEEIVEASKRALEAHRRKSNRI